MRIEDKHLGDDPAFESVRQRDNELEIEDEEALPELDVHNIHHHDLRAEVLDAMRMILESRNVVVSDLKLPKRELVALEALKAAVDGRDGELDQFVYASDRRELLESALAILQPSLVEQVDSDLVHRVHDLRSGLRDLDDAQDELVEARHKRAPEQGETDTGEAPEPDDDTSLTGPEREITKPPSSLAGPERAEDPEPPSSLGVVDDDAPKTVSDGPEASPEPQAAEDSAAPEPKKKPWWRRPFGG